MLIVTYVDDSWWPEVIAACERIEDTEAIVREHAASFGHTISSMVEGGEADRFVRHYRTEGGSVESRKSYVVDEIETEMIGKSHGE